MVYNDRICRQNDVGYLKNVHVFLRKRPGISWKPDHFQTVAIMVMFSLK